MVCFPLGTGEVARLLGCKERRVQEAIRLGVTRPPVVAGRRLWSAGDVLAVARHLGLDSLLVRQTCQKGA